MSDFEAGTSTSDTGQIASEKDNVVSDPSQSEDCIL
jgi:hypothetical protein